MKKINPLHVVSLLATVLFIQACSTSPTGRRQLILIPDGQMDAMGVQAFDQMKGEVPTSTDASQNAYVKCIADNIIATLDKDEQAGWEVIVFNDDSANAFALPGRKIGVHTGLLNVATNQHQLAAVMGHEVGHVLARHGAERVSQGLALEGGMAGVGAVMGNSKTAGIAMGALGLGSQFGVLLPFSRKHESEADNIGLDLMAKAGFNPTESVKLWENMAKASGGAAPPEFMSTHPSNQTRISDLKAGMTNANKLYKKAQAAGRVPQCKAVSGGTAKPAQESTETTTTSTKKKAGEAKPSRLSTSLTGSATTAAPAAKSTTTKSTTTKKKSTKKSL